MPGRRHRLALRLLRWHAGSALAAKLFTSWPRRALPFGPGVDSIGWKRACGGTASISATWHSKAEKSHRGERHRRAQLPPWDLGVWTRKLRMPEPNQIRNGAAAWWAGIVSIYLG